MIPSRGLRWSSQTILRGRQRLDVSSTRQFSSSHITNVHLKSNPLISNNISKSRIYRSPQFSKSNLLIRNATGIRFASNNTIASEVSATAAPASTNVIASGPQTITSSLDGITDITTESLLDIPEQIGYLKFLGLDYGWGPTAMMEWLLEHVHVFAGTPWWASIAVTSILVRAILFKPYMAASDNAARMSAIRHITTPLMKEITAAQFSKDTNKANQLRQEVQMINKRAGVAPYKSFVPMIQIFTSYGLFVCLRGMSKLPVPGLEVGGALWFSNLTVADPYLILPGATALILHWVLRQGGETGASAMSPRAMKIMSVAFPAMSFIFTWWLPAAVQVSFLTTGFLSYFQALLFKNKKFREQFDMYTIGSAAQSPKGPPPSNYKGTINIRARQAPLTQEELNTTYTKPLATATPEFKAGQEALRSAKPPGLLKKLLVGAVTDVKGSLKSVKESASDIVELSREKMDERQKRTDKDAELRHEKRRQEELKRERWELQNQKRAERAAKKMEKRSS